MKIGQWFSRTDLCADGTQGNTVSTLQSQERFRASVTRERRRVDRNQHILSLLLFTVGKQDGNGVAAQHFARVLAQRIRATDEVGWFDSKRLGVILPYTPARGAHKLADDICREATHKASSIEYTVHSYPANWFSDGDEPPSQFEIVDLPHKRKAKTSPGPSLPAPEGNCSPATPPLPSDTTRSCKAVPQAAEPFFQPLTVWKRIVDILGAFLGLVLLSPLLLLVALVIKLCYGGPVIFKQQRIGYAGKLFTMWKFRTMKHDAANHLHQQYMSSLIDGIHDESSAKAMTKLDSDLPITGFGRILRAMSIDELPQLVNVIQGDMSLIGPRPPTTYEVENYSQWHCERFGAVPGMTGLWQVSGKNRLTFHEMIRLDIKYVRGSSLWSDIVILLKTPLVIVCDIADFLSSRRKQS